MQGLIDCSAKIYAIEIDYNLEQLCAA